MILFNFNRLKKDFTEENLKVWAEFLAECNRANDFFKREGWSEGTVEEFDENLAKIKLEWGVDRLDDNCQEQYYDWKEYTPEEYFRDFDQLQKKLSQSTIKQKNKNDNN